RRAALLHPRLPWPHRADPGSAEWPARRLAAHPPCVQRNCAGLRPVSSPDWLYRLTLSSSHQSIYTNAAEFINVWQNSSSAMAAGSSTPAFDAAPGAGFPATLEAAVDTAFVASASRMRRTICSLTFRSSSLGWRLR